MTISILFTLAFDLSQDLTHLVCHEGETTEAAVPVELRAGVCPEPAAAAGPQSSSGRTGQTAGH